MDTEPTESQMKWLKELNLTNRGFTKNDATVILGVYFRMKQLRKEQSDKAILFAHVIKGLLDGSRT